MTHPTPSQGDKDILRALLKARLLPSAPQMTDYGHRMFTMYTQNGFPPDMFLDELKKRLTLSRDEGLLIVDSYLADSLEHKRRAGITEERVDKIRQANRRKIAEFYKTGELGVY